MITTSIWFGDSWCIGTELEKCLPNYQAQDQDAYRRQHRFSKLVSDYFGWEEINLGNEGISPEHVALKIVEYSELQTDRRDQIYFIIWPSFQRYFWINEAGEKKDLRWSSSNQNWYRVIDTYEYQMYSAKRTVWSTTMYLRNKGIKFAMVNNQYRLDSPDYFVIDDQDWILPSSTRLGDLLEVNLDLGFPEKSMKHKYFCPCESHPNLYGHKRIANEIINYIKTKEIACQF